MKYWNVIRWLFSSGLVVFNAVYGDGPKYLTFDYFLFKEGYYVCYDLCSNPIIYPKYFERDIFWIRDDDAKRKKDFSIKSIKPFTNGREGSIEWVNVINVSMTDSAALHYLLTKISKELPDKKIFYNQDSIIIKYMDNGNEASVFHYVNHRNNYNEKEKYAFSKFLFAFHTYKNHLSFPFELETKVYIPNK